LVSLVLVVANSGTTTSAAPVSTTINTSCGARDNDADTVNALNQAALLIGSNRLALQLRITANDIPESAGLDEEIDARFNVAATLDQALIDGAAALIPQIPVSNIGGTLLVNGPSSVPSFPVSAPNTIVRPVAGQPANVPLGTVGGPVTTTGGGIITYRVGSVQFDSSLSIGAPINLTFNLKLRCTVQGSNLIARTTVRDPDAPVFDPEVVAVQAAAGETVTVDLLGDVISEGKTPLLPETLEIVGPPAAGSASINGGVFSFTAPNEPGVYSTTVQVCGAPKPDSGIPGVSEEQVIRLGANWAGAGSGGLSARPVAFSIKVGDAETPLIWTINGRQKPLLLAQPTPGNWAPEDRAGEVGGYALLTTYERPTASQVRAALEAVPAIGAGNVEVTDVLDEGGRLEGFAIRYVNERAEQDMPNLSLGQWYAVPPQEVLDRLSALATDLAGGGDDDEGGEAPPGPFDGLDPSDPADRDAADKIITDEFAALRLPSPELWDAYLNFRLVEPILAAVPEILAFVTSLFPAKVEAESTTEGESPTPPQPLCAQGIIDVTVAEVADDTEVPPSTPAQVGGIGQERGIGFVG
jgi:hypothetical protein